MKKMVSLILAATMVFSLAACGGSSGSGSAMEKMPETAEEANLTDMNNEVLDNMAKAESTYVGNTYKVSGIVTFVESDYCVLTSVPGNQFTIHAYLDKEELAQLNTDEKITIVGEITEFVNASEMPYFEFYANMKPAYYVTNVSEMSGVITRKSSINGKPYCQIGGTAIYLDKETCDKLNEGDTITASGVITYDEKFLIGGSVADKLPNYHMKDAKLITE